MTTSPMFKEVVSFAAFVIAMGIFWRYIQRSFSSIQMETESARSERERMVSAFTDYLKENGTRTTALLDRLTEGHSRLIDGQRCISEQMQKTAGYWANTVSGSATIVLSYRNGAAESGLLQSAVAMNLS